MNVYIGKPDIRHILSFGDEKIQIIQCENLENVPIACVERFIDIPEGTSLDTMYDRLNNYGRYLYVLKVPDVNAIAVYVPKNELYKFEQYLIESKI